MKSVNMKIPIDLAQELDVEDNLNPSFMTEKIMDYLPLSRYLTNPVEGLCYNYTFKINDTLHKDIKIMAINMNLPMNELLGRLIVTYYDED